MQLPQLNYKKIFIIAGFVLISIALIVAVVKIFFISEKQEPEPDFIAGLEPGAKLPSSGFQIPSTDEVVPGREPSSPRDVRMVDNIAQGGETTVLPINDSRIIDPISTRDGRDIAFYDPKKGKFYRLSADGKNLTLLTDEQFFSVQSVSWSNSRDKAVIEYPDGANIIYDFTKRSSRTLPQEAEDLIFAPVSENIAFKLKTDKADDNWLVVTDSSGGSPKFIEPLGDKGDQVQVHFSPNEEVVALFHKPVGANQEEIFLIGQAGENFKSFVVDGLNFKGKYSPDGIRLLYHVISSSENYNPSLWVVDARGANIGRNKFNLGINTFVDKCVFADNSQIIYCAVPKDLEPGTGLAPRAEKDTRDIFYRINLDTGLNKMIARPVDALGEVEVSVIEIWLDKDESNLFFWDGITGKVFKMRLK